METESRRALHDLIATLREADERWVSPEWNLDTADDVTEAHRALMNYLQWGLVGLFERNPGAPRFHRIVDPDRKLLGDNPDAVYFDAPVSGGHAYRVSGDMKGAVYVSITVESGTDWGSMDNQVVGVINDTVFDADADGRFEIFLGGEPKDRNWLALPETSGSVSTRHYFEEPTHAAADPARVPVMHIEVVDGDGSPPPRPSDETVAAGIRRVNTLVRGLTVERVNTLVRGLTVERVNTLVRGLTVERVNTLVRVGGSTPSCGASPSSGSTPSCGASPSSGSTPSCGASPSSGRPPPAPSPAHGSRGSPTSSPRRASPAIWASPPSTPPTPWRRSWSAPTRRW